ncbi:DUF2809 domain-containing protein [Pseudanabaena sp. FACHB-1998]|uniref:ribosomal maturation YjgA family protein n=1 Tax=Pseudanabaena sp. FACHB-1998 TaxID=2692858 RepID=UPI0016817B9B|nr:DUF2809 domain-containing protein [Pseudanabaena sp. FACHB-1998]MBD2176126.1 DUF2809 domain-containing protein [Pseudanabaena sp. FACHB-1998]
MLANRLTFNRKYFLLTILLFLIEVWIAIWFDDRLIRAFVGDVLVVILIYCFIRSFWKAPVKAVALSVFIFACAIEGLQSLNLIDKLGLRQYKLLVIVLGSTFDWADIIAYALGTAIILITENRLNHN